MTIDHGFFQGTSSIGQVYPREFGCVGSPEDISELPLEVAMSSSLELIFASTVPAEGDLVGRGEVFLTTIGLDDNLHAELEDSRQ